MRRLEEDLKESLFNVIYVLLKDDETTFWKYFLLIAIDFFQILYYAFHEVVRILKFKTMFLLQVSFSIMLSLIIDCFYLEVRGCD